MGDSFKDFDRRFKRTNLFINAMFVVIFLVFVGMVVAIVLTAVAIAKAGPDGIAQAAGHAAAAFERARVQGEPRP